LVILAFLIVALVGLVAAYVQLAVRTKRPEILLYVYVGLWLIFPKALRLTYLTGGRYDFPPGITVFNVFEAIAALGIVVALITHRTGTPAEGPARQVTHLTAWLLGAGLVSLIISLGWFDAVLPGQAGGMSHFLNAYAHLPYRIMPVVSMLYALILVLGIARFIRRRSQLEIFFWLLAISGVELAIERLAFFNFDLLPQLRRFAVHAGRFNSIVFTSYDRVGTFAILAICASLYLALSGRRLAWGAFAVAWFPLIGTYQRAPILGAVAGVITVFAAVATRRQARLAGGGLLVIIAALAIAAPDHNPATELGRALGGSVRSNYFDTTDGVERLAYGKRALDVSGYMFPLGVGPDMAMNAMRYPIPGATAGLSNPLARSLYQRLSDGQEVTNPHDIYLEFLVDFGILGVLLMLAFAVTLVRVYRSRLTRSEALGSELGALRIAQSCALAMIVGLGLENLLTYDSGFPYWVYVFPVCLAAVSQAVARGQAASAQPAVVQTEGPPRSEVVPSG
jgi:hypothetical protein